jgi:hypothetical protein
MQNVGTCTVKSDTACEIESNFALRNPYVQTEEALAAVLLYLGHVFSPLRSPSIKNFKSLLLNFSNPCILVHQTLPQLKEVLYARSLHFGLESGVGGEVSKADIRVADKGPQSHTAYGLKESFEI